MMERGVDKDGLSGKTNFSGLLEKVTKTVFKSKKRMCVLTDRELLLYADNKTQGSPRSINLVDIQAVKRVNLSKGYHFELITRQKTETFAAESLDVCQDWIKFLQTAILNKRRSSSCSSISDPVTDRSYAMGHAYETVDLDVENQTPQIQNSAREALPLPVNNSSISAHAYETVDLEDGDTPRITVPISQPLCPSMDATNGPITVTDEETSSSSRTECETMDANGGPYSSLYGGMPPGILPVNSQATCNTEVSDIVLYSEPNNLKKSDLYIRSKEIQNSENEKGLPEDKNSKAVTENGLDHVEPENEDKLATHKMHNNGSGDVEINGSSKLYSEIDPNQHYSLASEPHAGNGTDKTASSEKMTRLKSDSSSNEAKVSDLTNDNIGTDSQSISESLSVKKGILKPAKKEPVPKLNEEATPSSNKKSVLSKDRSIDGDKLGEEVYDDIMSAEWTPIPTLINGPLVRDDAIVQLDAFLREHRGYSALYATVDKTSRQADRTSVKNLREFFSA